MPNLLDIGYVEIGRSKEGKLLMTICHFCYLQLMCSRGSVISNDLGKKRKKRWRNCGLLALFNAVKIFAVSPSI